MSDLRGFDLNMTLTSEVVAFNPVVLKMKSLLFKLLNGRTESSHVEQFQLRSSFEV